MKAETRCLPVFRKSDLDILLNNLTVEDDNTSMTKQQFDDKSAKAHGLLFFYVEHDTLVFAAPSGSVQEARGKRLRSYFEKLLTDPHVVKIGSYQHKRLIENFNQVVIINHLNPDQFHTPAVLEFGSKNEKDKQDRDPQAHILLKATRKVKTLIATYWNLVLEKTVAGKLLQVQPALDLSPWSRLHQRSTANLRGKVSSG